MQGGANGALMDNRSLSSQDVLKVAWTICKQLNNVQTIEQSANNLFVLTMNINIWRQKSQRSINICWNHRNQENLDVIDVSLGCSSSAQTCWYDFNWENLDVINTSLGFSNPLAAAKTLMQSRQKAKKLPADNSKCKNANLLKCKIYLFPELSQKSCAKLFTFQILWKLVWLIKWPKEILWLR